MGTAMKTSDLLLLNNCSYSPKRRIFVGHDKTIALVSSILAVAIIATGLVATAIAAFKQGELALNRAAGAGVAIERQTTRGGSLMGYTETW